MGKTVFLGVEGSGKTTLAVALLKAFNTHKSQGWYLRPLTRDSFRFVETMPHDFLKESFPAQTADLRELRWQLEKNGEILDEIEILDYPGEIYRLAFLDEKDERDKETFRQKVAANKREIEALLGSIKNAEQVFVLFSLDDAMDIKEKPRNLDAVWITYECLNTLKRLDPRSDIKLLFTQVDKYPEAELDIYGPMFTSLDLIIRNHGDVPRLFLSVVNPPESEFGIEQLLRTIVSAQTISALRKRFSAEVVDDIFLKDGAVIEQKLFREDKSDLNKKNRENARHYREQIREVADFALKTDFLCLVNQMNSVTNKQLREIIWIQEAVSKFLLDKTSNVLRQCLSQSKVETEWVNRSRLDLISKISAEKKAKVAGLCAVLFFVLVFMILACLSSLGIIK